MSTKYFMAWVITENTRLVKGSLIEHSVRFCETMLKISEALELTPIL